MACIECGSKTIHRATCSRRPTSTFSARQKAASTAKSKPAPATAPAAKTAAPRPPQPSEPIRPPPSAARPDLTGVEDDELLQAISDARAELTRRQAESEARANRLREALAQLERSAA